MRRLGPVTVFGIDGTGKAPEMHELQTVIWPAVIAQARAEFPDFDPTCLDGNTPYGQKSHPHRTWCTDRVMARFRTWYDLQTHNDIFPLLNTLADLHRDADQAVAESSAHYADLSKNTTINWLATHHRYVLATVRARTLLSQIADLTTTLADRKPDILDAGSAAYHYVYSKVPEDQRIVLPTREQADTAQLNLTAFVELSTTQFGILFATITGGYPPGFTPAIDPQVAGLLDGADWPISPALIQATTQAMSIPGPRPGDPDAPARNW